MLKTVWLYDELILQSTLTLNQRSIYSGLRDILEKNFKCIIDIYIYLQVLPDNREIKNVLSIFTNDCIYTGSSVKKYLKRKHAQVKITMYKETYKFIFVFATAK